MVNGDLKPSDRPAGSIAGKALWGMGFQPPANATMLAVGGSIQKTASGRIIWVGGNTRIGGRDVGNQMKITTRDNLLKVNAKTDMLNGYPYADQKSASIRQNLGRVNALKVDTDGDGTLDMDYNNYVSKTLIPLSDKLHTLQTTGTIALGTAPAVPNYGWSVSDANKYLDPNDPRPSPYIKVSLPVEWVLKFTGDGQNHRQVFNLNLDAIERKIYDSDEVVNGGFSLSFNNIPDGQAIIINVSKRNNIVDWDPGWRIWVNGRDYSTAINKRDASLSRYRSIASRIMWNFPNTTNLTLRNGSISAYADWGIHKKNAWYYDTSANQTNSGVLFPGSILLPRGSMYDYGDTNGRLLIGKDLTLDIWEHHNAPWIGFDEPQCFAVTGKTTATLQ